MTGFLDREHIIAGPGFNRWLVPPAALWGGWLDPADRADGGGVGPVLVRRHVVLRAGG